MKPNQNEQTMDKDILVNVSVSTKRDWGMLASAPKWKTLEVTTAIFTTTKA